MGQDADSTAPSSVPGSPGVLLWSHLSMYTQQTPVGCVQVCVCVYCHPRKYGSSVLRKWDGPIRRSQTVTFVSATLECATVVLVCVFSIDDGCKMSQLLCLKVLGRFLIDSVVVGRHF